PPCNSIPGILVPTTLHSITAQVACRHACLRAQRSTIREKQNRPTSGDGPIPTRLAAPIRALSVGIQCNFPLPVRPPVRLLPGASPNLGGTVADRPPVFVHRHSPGLRVHR